jgi:hypothetical protein
MKITRGKLRSIIKEMLLLESVPIDRATLEEIIDNAINRLGLGSVSNLRDFMIEIANAESGHNPGGLDQITHYKPNPFQVTQGAIKALSRRGDGSSNPETEEMRAAFNDTDATVDPWKDQEPDDVKSNKWLSAVAAVMYIMSELRGNAISGTVQGRAAQWESLYNREAARIDNPAKSAEKTESQVEMYIRKNS